MMMTKRRKISCEIFLRKWKEKKKSNGMLWLRLRLTLQRDSIQRYRLACAENHQIQILSLCFRKNEHKIHKSPQL
jgi:hypothetical protein